MLLKENVQQATITAEPPQGLACMEIWGGNRKVNIKRVALGILFGLGLGWPSTLIAQVSSRVVTESKRQLIRTTPQDAPFDVTRHSIPLKEIRGGGPPKDGIPALFDPSFVSPAEAGSLRDKDLILGVSLAGVSKAYPIRILNWHELVNDLIGARPILVSWCPLCGSGIVYDPVIDGTRYLFGVSGLLYSRNVLMYDRQTNSLWSQLALQAVTGPMAGTSLSVLPAEHTTWGEWKRRHPETLVLSFDTGYTRDYGRDPYRNMPLSRREGAAVFSEDAVKLYPFRELEKAKGEEVLDELAGQKVKLRYDRKQHQLSVTGEDGKPVNHFIAFLADLRTFYPDADIFRYRKR